MCFASGAVVHTILRRSCSEYRYVSKPEIEQGKDATTHRLLDGRYTDKQYEKKQ